MRALNKVAWSMLTDSERVALTLKITENLSTLKAGEIMGKSHYKFLEILDRGKALVKIFSEYLEEYGEIIPNEVSISPAFREYLLGVMVNRRTIRDTVSAMSYPYWMFKNHRDVVIAQEVAYLSRSIKKYNKDFALLIKDFDRWNNYRILPYAVQDPSAFKRRDKNVHIKNIRHITTITEYTTKILKERYEFIDKNKGAHIAYFVFITAQTKPNILTIHLKKAKQDALLGELGLLGFYVFKSREDAEKYLSLLMDYLSTDKDCKYGQAFWPTYRVCIKRALNHNLIWKKIPSRKYYADMGRDFDLKLAK